MFVGNIPMKATRFHSIKTNGSTDVHGLPDTEGYKYTRHQHTEGNRCLCVTEQ